MIFLSFFKHFAFFFAKHSLETSKVGNLKVITYSKLEAGITF